MWFKPIRSVKRERYYGYHDFYYLAEVSNIKKLSARYNLPTPHYFTTSHSQTSYWYTKKEVDRAPRYLRRGGIYGHDVVRLKSRKCENYKHVCRAYGIKYIVNA